MGISGLLPLLKSIHRPCNLKKFSGLTIGVDAYGWLHRGTVSCALDLALGKSTTKFVEFAMHRVRMLIHFGVIPYLVFDGDYLPSKGATEEERAKRRAESRRIGLQLYRAGKLSQAQQELQKAVDVTPEMARQLIDELKRYNIAYVVAPYEADAQLAYLERKGIIHGIISEDSDLLVFGAKRLLTKLDQYGDCVEINREDFTACQEISLAGWSDVEFRRMAILSGCDYLTNINNMGLKTSYRMVRKYKSIERILQMMQFEAKHRVPEGYLEDFRKADQTFVYQRVFCPFQKRVITATKPEDDFELDGADYIGKAIEPHIAVRVADGTLNPITKEPIVVDWQPLKNSTSPWLSGRKSASATPNEQKNPSKPIQSFFKPRRTPLAELDPNCFTPSPSQRRLQEQYDGTVLSSPVNPTANVVSIPNTGPASAPARIPSVIAASANHPPKRQRLCSESHDGLSPTDGIAATSFTKSRFFSGKASEPSPTLQKMSRQSHKPPNPHDGSTGSIRDSLNCLPDYPTPFKPSSSKISVFSDGDTESSNGPMPFLGTNSQITKVAVPNTSARALNPALSADLSGANRKNRTVERYCSVNNENLEDLVKNALPAPEKPLISPTGTPKNRTINRYCSVNDRTLQDLVRNTQPPRTETSGSPTTTSKNRTAKEYCSRTGKSMQDLVKDCAYASERPHSSPKTPNAEATGNESSSKLAQALVRTFTSKLPLETACGQREDATLYKSRSLDSGLGSTARQAAEASGYAKWNLHALAVARSPDTKKKAAPIGSEDFLIPNSEDEADDSSQTDSPSIGTVKLDLGRFIYMGQR